MTRSARAPFVPAFDQRVPFQKRLIGIREAPALEGLARFTDSKRVICERLESSWKRKRRDE